MKYRNKGEKGKQGIETSYGTFDHKQKEEAELRAEGRLDSSIYWNFFKAGNGYFLLALNFLVVTCSQVLFNGSDYWLKVWYALLTLNNKCAVACRV